MKRRMTNDGGGMLKSNELNSTLPRNRGTMEVVTLGGPHLILQREPELCAEQIGLFVKKVDKVV